MIEDSKYNNEFTAEDIERYYSGKMSSLEMHQLEKAAMEDPFLADALEGYSHTSTPVQDTEYLRTELQSKIEKRKVLPIGGFHRNQFLRIAALFILLAGCGWAVYQFGFNQSANDKVALEKPGAVAPSVATDSNNNNAALQQSAPGIEKNSEVTTKEKTGTENNETTQITTIQDDGKGTISLSTQNRHTGKLNGNANYKKKEKAQNDEELKQIETAIPSDAVRDEVSSLNKARYLKGDSGALAAAQKTDTANIVAGYGAQRQQTVTPGKENVIVLQRSKSEPMPEVMLSKESRKDSTYRKPRITFEEAEPENGSAYYDDYVAQNLQMPEEKVQKNISGEVKLSFDINDAGEAVNITVEKSLCTECDKEAIRLLKAGPKWKKKKDKKGKLSIKF